MCQVVHPPDAVLPDSWGRPDDLKHWEGEKMSTPGAVPASMGKRLLAAVIDGAAALLLGGAFVVVGLLPALQAIGDPAGAQTPQASPLVLTGYALLLAFAVVQWWYLGTRGYTVGKRLVGLRVLHAETGRPVGLGKALVRLLVPAAGALACLVGQWVVLLSPLFDSSGRRQGWHDKAGGTVVFDTAVGRDPAVVGTGAPDAARRIDGLLRQQAQAAAPPSAYPPPAYPPPAGPTPTPVPPLAPPLAATPPGAEIPPAPAPAPAPSPAPAPGPAPAPVPLPSGRPTSSIISGVPGALAPAPRPSVPQDQARTGLLPSTPPLTPLPTGPLPSLPAARSGAVRPPEPAPATPPPLPPLDADVEHTRLSHASRRAVPEVEHGGRPVVRAQLRLWDDRHLTLEGTALIGRNPAPREGEAPPDQVLTVPDTGRSVSKTHLVLGVDADGVWLRDRNSTNGTVVTLADGQQILCAPEQKVRVPDRASVAFGDFWLTVGV